MKDLLLFRCTLTRQGFWGLLGLFMIGTSGLFMIGFGILISLGLVTLENSPTPAQNFVFGIGVYVYFYLSIYEILVVSVARCKDADISPRFTIPGLLLVSSLPSLRWAETEVQNLCMGVILVIAVSSLIFLGVIPTEISEEDMVSPDLWITKREK